MQCGPACQVFLWCIMRWKSPLLECINIVGGVEYLCHSALLCGNIFNSLRWSPHCMLQCRLLNIEDLQNAELWQKAGLLAADQNELVA